MQKNCGLATIAHRQSEKNLFSSNISSTYPPQYGELSLLAAEIISLVWGTPPNFNGFRVLASLLQQHRSTEANQTLHSVWPLPGLVDYIYIFGGCCSITEFSRCKIHFAPSKSCDLLLAALLHSSQAVAASQTAALRTGRHLYSAGRPSRWALAHILVSYFFHPFRSLSTGIGPLHFQAAVGWAAGQASGL